MPLARYGLPGLLGAADPAYVVAGVAPLTSAISRWATERASEQELSASFETAEQAVAEAEAEAAAAERVAEQYARLGRGPAPAAAGGDDLVGRLGELARLRDVGALTAAEYDTAKARLLGT